ncbi:MAG: 23S rRNA (uracil(1939)-C(5))-methyltransferase RlmD [Cyclobacteriaceae bacterium]
MSHSKVIENLEITGISAEGKSIARHDNRVLFVAQAVPGDVVDVQITRKKRKFFEGKAIHFHKQSAERQEPFCEHFGTCGGCKWQHMQYEAQLNYKARQVIDNLKKIGKTDLPEPLPILGSADTTFYRNKLEFTFSDMRWLTTEEIASGKEFSRNALGFHIPGRFDKILDIEKCWLQPDPSNEIRNTVKDYALRHNLTFFNLRDQHGLLRNLIIRTTTTGETMVIVQFFEPDEQAIDGLMEHIKEKFPSLTSLLYIINQKGNETFHDQEVHTFHGQDYITERMGELQFRIGPKSFYQTNPVQAEKLYQVALDFADLQGNEMVYDLYCGTGTITNYIAHSARKVVGIEYVEEAIVDARVNSKLNSIDNTEFYAGDIKDLLTESFVQKTGRPDVIITDPPRAGMHGDVVKQLNEIKPEKIVYVSCNPATQARDLQLLSENYSVKSIQPVDMFPQTHHVENVLLLVRK